MQYITVGDLFLRGARTQLRNKEYVGIRSGFNVEGDLTVVDLLGEM